VMQNAGPARLFDHALATERRAGVDWFLEVAPREYQVFYETARELSGLSLPRSARDLTSEDRAVLRNALRQRRLPEPLQVPWSRLCGIVADESATRWAAHLQTKTAQLRMLWRLMRVGDAPYFLLGSDRERPLRLRVASSWDWVQRFELRSFHVEPRKAGQPEVAWFAEIRDRSSSETAVIVGHVEIRWSHGRFAGAPEAKIYLDTRIEHAPGYFALL